MTAFRGVWDRWAQSAARLNGVIIPAASLPTTLANSAVNLVVWNDHETFTVSLVGSATTVMFKGRYFLLCTQHQLRDVNPEHVSLLIDGGKSCVSSSGARSYPSHSDTDSYDIVAFDFTEACLAHPELQATFYRLGAVPPDVLNTEVIGFQVAGFPVEKQLYELHEHNRVGLRKQLLTCVLDGQPSDPCTLRIRTTTKLSFDPDGMSGGPAFVVQNVGNEIQAYFAGIVLRGGGDGFFYILKAGYVGAFLNSVLNEAHRASAGTS